MDPFSLTVGISGLVTLSASVLKLIQQYFHGIKHAGDATSELQLVHNVLCRLDGFLRSDIANRQSFGDTSVLISSMSACRVKLDFLHKKLDAAAKSRLLRVLWPLNEKEHSQTVQELRVITQCIQFAMTIDECALLSKTSEEVTEALQKHLETFQILTEISHSTTSLELSIKEQTQILQKYPKIQEREKILDWISNSDSESKHNAIRMPRVEGTGEWLTETKEFKAWRISVESPSVLWCHGIQGAGKSILTSLVIDRLRDVHIGQKIAIAFVYFDYRDKGSQSLENTVASLLRQVVSQKSVLPTSLVELYKKLGEQKMKPQVQDLERILLHICQDFDQVFILIDALDECDEAMRRKHFLPFLAALQKISSIRLFVTSRPYPEDIRNALDPVPQIHVQASDADLRMYLRRKIEESGNADIIDEDFKQRLIDTVTRGAQGSCYPPCRSSLLSASPLLGIWKMQLRINHMTCTRPSTRHLQEFKGSQRVESGWA